ncbi:acetylserotonin O-methyltransferase [Streptomyces hainanensis]|uniref:acetylserotonin O-methyltransferase n=1 Tax=Streptomyces hainanensis TaxID=402648 RepID=UPI001FB77091|nr:acetylserotonin O-methyltransferase [Streptomyces hainanensis]
MTSSSVIAEGAASATDTAGVPADFIGLTNSLCDAQALLTALELDLFGTLAAGPAHPDTLRATLGLHGRGLADWLDLLVHSGMLERHGDRYRNAPVADRYLVRGGAHYTGDVLRRRMFPALLALTESLRTGAPHGTDEFTDTVSRLDVVRQFADQMDFITDPLAGPLLAAYDDWGRHRSVLDVGGCRGGLLSRLLAAHPHLTGQVFDLPMMAPLAAEQAAAHGLRGRLTFHAGNFFTDPLPASDVVVMGHTLVNWPAERRAFLLRALHASVNPGGVLLVYDRMLTGALDEAERHNLRISLSMLVLTRGGSGYPLEELRSHATAAGFAGVTHQRLGAYDTLVVCRKAPVANGASPGSADGRARGQVNGDVEAAVGQRRQAQRPVVGGDDRPHDGQAET